MPIRSRHRPSFGTPETLLISHTKPRSKPIITRLRSRPHVRPEHLTDLRRALDKMPQRFRLGLDFDGDRKAFYVAMLQVIAGNWHIEGGAINMKRANQAY
jgi:hypothetical protein